MGKLFGTDGIRGLANNGTMNPFVIPKIGAAAGVVFSRGKEHHRYRALVGKDTRLSNYMIEDSIISGLVGVGMDVIQTGPIPTPAVAYLTESMRADVGIMLTASHNPFEDNGIKFFGPDGFKLTKEQEHEIEDLVFADLPTLAQHLVKKDRMGRQFRNDFAKGEYKGFVKGSLSKGVSFGGMRIVLDCAHGAGYELAPLVFSELDAEVIAVGVEPNGTNINKECGSNNIGMISKEVRKYRADLGIALDGDADRVALVDEQGREINGDQVLALIASTWKQEGRLAKPVVVGTSMSNLGLERYLNSLDIKLERTDVGDHNILRVMRDNGYNVGGEQSGHIVLSDFARTGDGILAGLQIMSIVRASGKKASEVCHCFDPVPQILENVRYNPKLGNPLDNEPVHQTLKEVGTILEMSGARLLVRPSGTESVIRVMAEGDNRAELYGNVMRVVEAIKSVSN
jgi:phosphoglucosamine mutase